MGQGEALLDEPLAARARAAIDRLIDDVLATDDFGRRDLAEPQARASLAAGLPGQLVFLGHAAASRQDERLLDRCIDRLEGEIGALVAAAGEANRPGLFQGLAGIGFAVEHLVALDLIDDVEAIALPLRDGLMRMLHDMADLPCELAYGTAGVGAFGLERLIAGGDSALAERALERLHAEAVADPPGRVWRVQPHPRWIGPDLCRQFPDGHVDTGMAHGAAGCLTLAGAALARGLRTDLVGELCQGGLEWFGAREQQPAAGRWPAIVGSDGRGQGWCRGGLGIGFGLFVAARALGDAARADWAAACVGAALDGEAPDTIGFCHGHAGAAVIAQLMYRATGAPRFRERARAALERCVAAVEQGAGAGPGLLDGVAGVGAVLLGALDPAATSWSRCFLPGGDALAPP